MEESEYVSLVRKLFDHGQEMSYEEENTFLFLLNGPEQYENEPEMLEYLKENPACSMNDLFGYWASITPPGLPPGMTEEDLLDDEED